MMFKKQIEFVIDNAQVFARMYKLTAKYTVYNCTEGGARIENTIEMPFSKACERFLKNAPKKDLAPLQMPAKSKQEEALLGVYARTKKQILKSEDFALSCANKFETIAQRLKAVKSLNSASFETNKPYFEECDRLINEVKEGLEDVRNSIYVYEVLDPTVSQFETHISSLFVYNPQNEAEKNQKMFAWIEKHIDWLGQLVISAQAQKQVLENSLCPLQNALKKQGKGIEAKMQMIDTKPREALMFW